MDESNDIPLINIRQVFKDKSPKLAKWIPGFMFRFFERLLHQEDMNRVLTKAKGKQGVDFARACFDEIGVTINSKNLHFIPTTGRVILASNHPLGGLDGMGYISEAHKIRPNVKFLVNDILLNIKPLQGLFLGVNKLGANAKLSLLEVERQFASDRATLIFPAGMVSRNQNGRIFDLKWHKSFITKSVKYQTDIIPTFIDGENSKRFYNIAKWRKRLFIKLNIEMLLLPSEMFKQKGKTITVYFGKPIPAYLIKNIGEHHKIANAMRHFVYLIKDDPNADFETFYHQFKQK
ncbi:MAG: glycerol acyltransferase [Bacteroidetes bacterium]|nr:glycerol acyltransferase [Bacteroidota bacterium]